ncbi:MAG: mechanosensitive ion channel [Potamolinea sp.]
MTLDFQQFLRVASELFTVPMLKIGETGVSLSLILGLIVSLLIVISLTGTLKKFLKKKLLVRLRIDEGNREAIATIISYAIGTFTFVIVLQSTGFNLSSLAVLAGALGVGIGLGLQDLTKNFASGLTLLMERKLKVGDFVEFDGLSGYIKEVAIRSTLIRTRDGSDVVVPNSKLVDNRLINWSYDNFTARIKLSVKVAYESDPVLVTETLLKSAYMETAVLHEPPPEVIFTGFGDSSLDLELWVWVNRIDREAQIKSSLNFIIEYNLRQQKITFPFPQRDLWIRNPEVLTRKFHPRRDSKDVAELAQQHLPKQPSKPLAIRDLLRSVTYFQNLTDLELRQLVEIGYRKRLKSSEVLFREDEPGDAFYIILAGSVEVFVEKINKSLTTLQVGQFFGELSLMLGIPRTATVQAIEETLLFVINNKGFEKLLQKHPDLAEVIVQELGKHQEELAVRQQELRELGLLDSSEDDSNVVNWVRKRLEKLFNL